MICIKCYERLKSFEEYKDKCIQNQIKFQNVKEAIVEQQENDQEQIEEEVEDIIEYEDAGDDEIYEDESSYMSASQDEVAGAVEKILDVNEQRKPRVSVTKRLQTGNVSKKESKKDPEKEKGKESYQKLLQQCEICLKMIERNRMEGHINKHNNYRPFSCPECDKTFYCKQLLRLHRTSLHTNMLIKCDICNKMFPSTRALYSHNLRHKNQDRYQCEFCEVNFI